MSTFTCQATVYVPDWDAEDACDLPAMGYVWDEEFGQWPACTQHRDRNTGIRADLTDLIARRPELRDVGIAGYLVGAAVDGGPGMPPMRGSFFVQATPTGIVWTWVAAA
jgi:hypothetical protein